MGLDEKSKGVRIYWLDSRTVGVEHNVYVDKTGASASRLEGEEWDGFGETNTNTPITSNTITDPHIVRTPFLSTWNIFANFDPDTLKFLICTLLYVMNIF